MARAVAETKAARVASDDADDGLKLKHLADLSSVDESARKVMMMILFGADERISFSFPSGVLETEWPIRVDGSASDTGSSRSCSASGPSSSFLL